jgi:histidyl-tRNA synthetase
MTLLATAVRGTHDILPAETGRWQELESRIRKHCSLYGYKEIRTPIFEYTELFLRGIGETTDVVEKEMYTFEDRAGRSMTLRPECTASTVRSYLEHKMYGEPNQPTKLYYIGSMFRYDKPQAGRYRQFHQFGIEAIGSHHAATDAEIISLAYEFFVDLGLTDLNLYINSVGCSSCRPNYQEKLKEFFVPHKEKICKECLSRLERNPLRLLDCKNENCQNISVDAPKLLDHLCDGCNSHFDKVRSLLTASQISYTINTRLVRGLDYYTKTAFEIQYTQLGAQSAICGGGRYDGLIEECGGDSIPGIGFAMGMERILIALDQQNLLQEPDTNTKVFVMPLAEVAESKCFEILQKLRKSGISAEMDLMSRGVKGQMKQANRLGVHWAILLGEDELSQNTITCKNMVQGEQCVVKMVDFEKWIENLREEE